MNVAKTNPVLQIDPEFESKIPPLTDDEHSQLEENILSEGAVLMPLIVWKDTIVDGHNRYKIVQEHPEISFDVIQKDFENRYEALVWICKNQLGRRNLTPEQKDYLIGHRYKAEKMAHGANDGFRGNQHTDLVTVHSEPLPDSHVTRLKIAEESGVSASSVMRDEWYADGVDAAERESPGAKEKLLTGKVKARKKDVAAIARASPEKRKSLVDSILCPSCSAPDKETLTKIQDISDDLGKSKPSVSEDSILASIQGEVITTMQTLDDLFDDWPQLISDKTYKKRVVKILHDLKQYIIHIEGGTRYEYAAHDL